MPPSYTIQEHRAYIQYLLIPFIHFFKFIIKEPGLKHGEFNFGHDLQPLVAILLSPRSAGDFGSKFFSPFEPFSFSLLRRRRALILTVHCSFVWPRHPQRVHSTLLLLGSEPVVGPVGLRPVPPGRWVVIGCGRLSFQLF